MPAEWHTIPSYPEYEASDAGEIRRRYSTRFPNKVHLPRKPQLHYTGHLLVGLVLGSRKNTKTRRVNRLVCEAFHGEAPSERHQAAHGDGNPLNNRPGNLRWATRAENESDKLRHGTRLLGDRHPNAKLTDAQVIELRARWKALPRGPGGPRRKIGHADKGATIALAREFGIALSSLYGITSGKLWRHL